jgi:hypothetical protein
MCLSEKDKAQIIKQSGFTPHVSDIADEHAITSR